jgi:hypothetical protein
MIAHAARHSPAGHGGRPCQAQVRALLDAGAVARDLVDLLERHGSLRYATAGGGLRGAAASGERAEPERAGAIETAHFMAHRTV